jgi:hypothetical protein
MLRLLSGAAVAIFAAGFYAGVHLQSATCRVVHGMRPALTWIDC